MNIKILLLPGDGIGHKLDLPEGLLGGCALPSRS